jgi:hypothetical protein
MGASGELKVITDAMRHAAGIWDQQASAIGSISGKVEGMSLGRFEAGVFQLIVSPYDGVVTQVAGRCQEGQHNMQAIAVALDNSANNYDTTEQTNTADANSVG